MPIPTVRIKLACRCAVVVAAATAMALTACDSPGPGAAVTPKASAAPTPSPTSTTHSPKARPGPRAAMTQSDLTSYLTFFARHGPKAMTASAAPPYRIATLDTVFTGELREAARFKSVYYRAKGYREKGKHTITGTGPIFTLPKTLGRNAALVLLTYRSGAEGTSPEKDLMLLVQDAGTATWRLASMTEVPYLDQLPTPAATPSLPNRAQVRAAEKFVAVVVRYLEKGTIPRGGQKLGVAPYEWRQRIERAAIGGPVAVDVSRLDTGVPGTGPGAPITVIPVQGGVIAVAQLVATVTADSDWAPGGESDTNDLYQQALGRGRSRTRDALAITFVIPDEGDPAVIGGDLGLMLPK